MKTLALKFLSVVALLAAGTVAQAQQSIYLKTEPPTEGESVAVGHMNEIDALAFSFGVSNSGSVSSGGGGGAGKANFQDLGVTKYVDIASPHLVLACASGKIFKEVTLTVARNTRGNRALEFMTIKLSNALVSSVSLGGSEGDRLTENVTFNYQKIEFTVRKQNRDGTLGPPMSIMWDVAGEPSY
jgi:type VI secretion system secreted protein Hcp